MLGFFGPPRDLSRRHGQICHLPFFHQPTDIRKEGRWIVGKLAFAALTVCHVSALHVSRMVQWCYEMNNSLQNKSSVGLFLVLPDSGI